MEITMVKFIQQKKKNKKKKKKQAHVEFSKLMSQEHLKHTILILAMSGCLFIVKC